MTRSHPVFPVLRLTFGLILGLVPLLFSSFALGGNNGVDANGCYYELEEGVYHCRRGELAGRSFDNQAEIRQALIVRQAARHQDKQAESIPKPGKAPNTTGVLKK